MTLRRAWLGLLVALLLPGVTWAVPTLQLYSPDAVYDTDTETWVIPGTNPFELWVIGALSPDWVDVIEDVMLYISVPTAYYLPGGSVSIQGLPSAPPVPDPIPDVDETRPPPDPIFGTPPDLPPHGIFPTYFWTVSLPDLMVATAGETILDYQPDQTGVATGDIQKYEISYSGFALLAEIHFDLTGLAVDTAHQQFRFAPFSHDLSAHAVPEPGTLLLLLTGVAGVACRWRRRS